MWATPEEVAEAMLRCLQEPDLGGGTILEVGANQTRLVEALVSDRDSVFAHRLVDSVALTDMVF